MPKAEEYKNLHFELIEVTITGNQEITPGVHLISWKRTHDFQPGAGGENYP